MASENFCNIGIDKVKSTGALTAAYKHNFREGVEVENADPELAYLNEEIIPLPRKENGERKTYADVFHERIDSLEYFKTHKIRSNAVYALKIELSFTANDLVSVEAWKRQNAEFLKEKFNVAPDGKDNVISLVYHADEPGNIHCHAIVIPIDEKGHLNASRFTDGSRIMSEYQTAYAKKMENLGLKRGVKGSTAKHKDIRKFYAELNDFIHVPEVRMNETATEYRDRYIEFFETKQAALMRNVTEKEISMRRGFDQERLQEKQALEREFTTIHKAVDKEINKLEKKKSDLEKEIDDLIMKNDEITFQLLNNQKILKKEINDIRKKCDFYDRFSSAYDLMKNDNPEDALQLMGIMERMSHYSLDRNDNDVPEADYIDDVDSRSENNPISDFVNER